MLIRLGSIVLQLSLGRQVSPSTSLLVFDVIYYLIPPEYLVNLDMNLFNKFTFSFLTSIIFLLACSDKGEIPNPKGPDPSFDSKFPFIEINTSGNPIFDEPKSMAAMRVVDIVEDSVEITDYEGMIGIEIRGSSSTMFDKKSYGLETRDADDMDLDTSIYGMPIEEDWILNGPYSDKSLIRNVLIYDISNNMGRYASRTKLCELYINSDYKGVYVFMEKLKRDKERIDVNKLKLDEIEGEDLTGGYILKIDKTSGNGGFPFDYTNYNSIASAYNTEGQLTSIPQTHFLYEYPNEVNIRLEQRDYISNYMKEFESALAGSNFMDPESGYRKYIDVESFVDYLILNEFAHNPDAYRLSTYLYKDKNGLLNIGPIWDFNIAFGNSDFCEGGEPNNWVFNYNNYCPDDAWLVHFWWKRLLSDPFFSSKVKTRYQELRTGVLSTSSVNATIDNYANQLIETGAAYRNYQKYKILNTYVWPNRNVAGTYDAEIAYLKSWISQRTSWLDTNVPLL